MFNINDYIEIESLLKQCPHQFDGKTEPPEGIVFCAPELAATLFSLYTKKEYTLVSCASDASLVYQKYFPVNRDADWYFNLLRTVCLLPPDHEYVSMRLPPRCSESCDCTHKYSVKYISYTQSTFPEIPPNIKHWYMSNLMIDDDHRLTCIPFGIPKNSTEYIYKKEKSKLLYVNFQEFSNSIRTQLRNFYRGQPWLTFVEEAVPLEQYKKDLAEHQFILSPPGNGVDCYRIWESIYSGSIPIIQNNYLSQFFQELPILNVSDLFKITPSFLETVMRSVDQIQFSLDKAKLSYWRHEIFGPI